MTGWIEDLGFENYFFSFDTIQKVAAVGKDAWTQKKNHDMVLQPDESDAISEVGAKNFIHVLDLISCSCKCCLAYYQN